MGTVRKTITLSDQQASWMNAQIEAGYYTSDSECVSDKDYEKIENKKEDEVTIKVKQSNIQYSDFEKYENVVKKSL